MALADEFQVGRLSALSLRESEIGTQPGKCRSEASTKPVLNDARFNDHGAKGMRHDTIDHKNCKCHRHKNTAQKEQLCERRG